ncbi:MAG: helix-turn-helix domain-containing protein [Bacteroidia bacterium]
MMDFKRLLSCEFLRPYVHCFWYLEASEKDFYLSVKIPPVGYNGIIFTYSPFESKAKFHQSTHTPFRCSLCGIFTAPYSVDFKGQGGFIGLLFKPGALFHIFGVDMSVVGANQLDAEAILGSEISAIFYRIQEANSIKLKVEVLEEFLIKKLKAKSFLSLPLEHIVAFINEQRGNIKIDEIAKYFKCSTRFLERNFSQIIGIPPKKYSNIVQFNNLLKDIQDNKKIDWCGLAANGGYYDQQHLINTFSKFTGLPPTKYIDQDNTFNEFYLLKESFK